MITAVAVSPDHPQETADLDNELKKTVRSSRRIQMASLVILGFVLVVGFLITGFIIGGQRSELNAQSKELDAACSFFRDLTSVPVKPVPPLKRPSKLSVLLVAHSRTAYIGLDCQPPIPQADPSETFWGRYYKIKVP